MARITKIKRAVKARKTPVASKVTPYCRINGEKISLNESIRLRPTLHLENVSNFCLRYSASGRDRDEKIFNFVVQRLPHCCTVREIGNITFGGNTTSFEAEPLRKILDSLLKNSPEGYTFITNLSTGKASNRVLHAALERSSNWTAVKSFESGNSGNQLTIWMSNND